MNNFRFLSYNKNKIFMKYIFLLILSFLFGCSTNPNKQLDFALQMAGENRSELESVLNHYKNDSLKLKAAHYLIENMPYHFSMEEYFVSPNGETYRPDIVTLSENNTLKNHCDSIQRLGYKYVRKKKMDITSLNSNFIINNIELAFEVWQKPWAKNIPFHDFCKYILPYRTHTETISSLRKEMMNRFMPILDSAKVSTSLYACEVLNEYLKGIIKYKNYQFPFYQTIDETYRAGFSQCDGLCDLGAFIMRSVGIPVVINMTTWTKMDMKHRWCAVLDNGKFYSFGPGESQPVSYDLFLSESWFFHPAKVYRFSFEPKISDTDIEDDGYITYLKNPFIYDVTREHLVNIPSINITTKIKNEKSSKIYLCAFNQYEWRPIAIGYRNEYNCFINNIVGDNIFIIADSPESNKLRYITPPFYLSEKGTIHKFIPRKTDKQKFTFNKLENKLDREHTLFYWNTDDNQFIPLSFSISTDTTQTYDQIPRNALLWFTIEEKIINQRIFFIDNDSIKYY